MVFQLPILDFPEGRPQLSVNEYDHFRPYLATRTLRFSYGDTKDRARGAWQHDCGSMTPAELVQSLENDGFAALYVNRQGYPDDAANLLAELAAAGRAEVIQGPLENPLAVVLHAVKQPQPPLARSFTLGQGWNRRAPGESASAPRWTYGSASLSYYNPYPHPLQASARLVLSSVGERTVRLLVNDRERTRLRVGAEPKEVTLPAIALRPGVNRLELDTPEPAIRVSEQRLHLRAIAVHQMQLQVLAQPMVELIDDPTGAVTSGNANSPNDRSGS
jgi:hypothetical protein